MTDQPLDATENSDQKPVLSWVPNGLGNKKLSPNAALEFVRKIADMKINGIATQESKNSLDKSNKTYKYTITLLNDEVIVFELLKLQNEEDFLMFTSQRDGVYRLPPLYGKDLILSSSIDALTGSAEKNIDD